MVGLTWLLAYALTAGGFTVVDFILVVLFVITLPWSVIGFWNATIGLFIMRSADPVAAVTPVSARVTRRRADHGQDRDPLVRAQRGYRARHPQHRADDGRDRGLGRGGQIPCLHPERHELSRDRRSRGAALRATEGEVAGPARAHLSPPHRQHRLQGRQYLRFLHALGRATTSSPSRSTPTASRPPIRSCAWCASCRSIRSSASCKASWSACRRPARSRASSSSACGSACAPTRSAAHGGRATAARTGGTTRSSASRRSSRTATSRRARTARTSSRHDQIEAVLMRRAGYEVRVLPEEGASWEENPPTLLEFIRRDLRWAQGNMQYWPYLVMPGLEAREPLPDRVRDADVFGVARLDGTAGARHARRCDPGTGEFHPARCRDGAVRHHADHVVCAEDRDRDRRRLAARNCATPSAAPDASSPAPSPRRSSS